MKKILKFIFALLIILILLVGIPVGLAFFFVSDAKDEAPTDLYTDSVNFQTEIDGLFSRFFVNREGAFYLTFSEEELDRLVFALIKNINSDYYRGGCESDECRYIQSVEIPAGVPLLGGQKVHLRHAYTEVGANTLNLRLTVIAPYLKTSLNMGVKFEKEDGTYIFKIVKFSLGKLNVMSGIGKSVATPLLSGIGFTEEKINQYFVNNGLPLEFEMDDYSIRFEKEAIGAILLQLVGGEQQSPEEKLLKEMVNILSSSENNLLDLGFYNFDEKTYFGFKVDLNEIKTDPEVSLQLAQKRAQAAKGFDAETFVANKTQTFIIGSLAATGETKITFTNQDFNRIIYEQTNGYHDFKYSLAGNGEYNFVLTGIFIDFTPTLVTFQFVVEINGIEVLIEIAGDIASNDDESELTITLKETMSIGGIQASSDFLLELLGGLESLSAVAYDHETGSFTISATTFSEMMEVGGPATPLFIEKIKAAAGGIDVYVGYSDSGLANLIEQAQEDLRGLLQGDFLDETQFDTSDPEQESVIQELKDALEEISEILNDPEALLGSEATENLIGLINSLSDENQKILLDQITESANSIDLESLYEQLFGK